MQQTVIKSDNSSHMNFATLFKVWFTIGIQSFGGGMATLSLIRTIAVEREKWLSDIEFARYWSLCQVAPGINLLALTTLLGRRIAGIRGIVVCLAGLLFPSVTITIILTAFYSQATRFPLMTKAMHGIMPATIGLGIYTLANMTISLLKESQSAGKQGLYISIGVCIAAACAMLILNLQVFAILIISGLVYAFYQWRASIKEKETE